MEAKIHSPSAKAAWLGDSVRVLTCLLDGFRELKRKYEIIGDVRGIGLMVALEFIVPGVDKKPNGEAAMAILNNCLQLGLIGYMAGLRSHVVRFMPPLSVNKDQVNEALTILNKSLDKFTHQLK